MPLPRFIAPILPHPGLASTSSRTGRLRPRVVRIGGGVVDNQKESGSVGHGGQSVDGPARSQVHLTKASLAERVGSTDYLRALIAEHRVSYGMLARVWNVDKKRAYVMVTRPAGPGAARLAELPGWMRKEREAA